MFAVGELIFYGNEGVCRVEAIGVPPLPGVPGGREYYTLCPLYREEKIYIPVDTQVFMRPVISREEALALIARIPCLTAQVCEERNPRLRSEQYRASLRTHDCDDLVRLIKSVHGKQRAASQRGKKLGQAEEQFGKRAEELLHGELAVALGIEKDAVPAFIAAYLRENEAAQAGAARGQEEAPGPEA